MEEPVLRITKKRFTEESAVISIRLPKDMLGTKVMLSNRGGKSK